MRSLTKLIFVCVSACLCVSLDGAEAHRHLYYDVDAAMACWNDSKVRQGLASAGLVGGYYKAIESGSRVLVEAAFSFKGGGKMSYRQYHAKDKGFPGPVELVRLYYFAKKKR